MTQWRYLLLIILLFSELFLILSPSPTPQAALNSTVPLPPPAPVQSFPILSTLFPTWLPYQHVLFLHQLFVSLSVCISHLAPVLFPDVGLAGMNDRDMIKALEGVIQRLSMVGTVAERESAYPVFILDASILRRLPRSLSDDAERASHSTWRRAYVDGATSRR